MSHMKTLAMTAATIALLAPFGAQAAGPLSEGWYVGAEAMMSHQTDSDSEVGGVTNSIEFTTGWGVGGSAGYAWGNGIRTEGEIAYRRSNVDDVTGTGSGPFNNGELNNISFMGNALYDFDTGTPFTPYLGAGIGGSIVHADEISTVNTRTLDGEKLAFAYQGIAGVSAALDDNWSASVDYRYFRTTDADIKTNVGDKASTGNASHNIVFGLRYLFDQEEPAPAPMPRLAEATPAPAPVPQPVARPVVAPVAQSYMVFFDFDKSNLTPEAKRIIASAAQDFKAGKYVRLVVTGHTDTMGSVKYNQRLSERRAASVKQEFAYLGVPTEQITTVGAGKSSLLVPTNDHVREAQNRRAEIVLNK